MMFSRLTGSALTLCLTTAPALADLSVDDAWNTWQAQIKALGMTLQADQTRDGDAIQTGELTISANLPMDAGQFSISFAGPRFEPAPNGAVAVSFPVENTLSFTGNVTDEGKIDVILNTRMINSVITMTGTPDRVLSTWTADGAAMALVSASLDDIPLENTHGVINLDAYTYEALTTLDERLTIAQTARYDGYDMDYSYDMDFDGNVATNAFSGFVKNMDLTQTLVLPRDGISVMDLPALLRDGMSLIQSSKIGSYGTSQETRTGDELMLGQKTFTTDYDLDMRLDHTGLNVTGAVGEFSTEMQVVTLPFPIIVNGGSAKGSFRMPMLREETPQDAGMQMDLQGMTVNPEVWSMVDAGGQLPHDPIALTVDVDGQITLAEDLLDFTKMALRDGPEGLIEPVSANLKSLLLSAVGTELTGSGALTFDASDYETLPGMARPEGALDFKLTGASALLDTLVEMGLVPEDEAMGARMMMGLFGVPAEGADAITSKIEFTPEGHILANGQRLR